MKNTDPYVFREISRNTSPERFTAVFRLENDFYEVHFYYSGEYERDKAEHQLSLGLTTSIVKPKGESLMLKTIRDLVLIDDPLLRDILPRDVSHLKDLLTIAEHSAIALQKALHTYFL